LNDNTKPKVIYVIYDNSTSMIRDDIVSGGDGGDDSNRYTTRWVEASYGVQALATMMNQKDILRIYPISNGEPGKEMDFEKMSLEAILDEIRKQISRFGFEGVTSFKSVEKAAEDMRKDYNNEYDYWIVILTDGMFKEFTDMMDLEEALDNINSNNAGKPISLAYIYISGGSSENTTGKEEMEGIKGDNKYLYVPDAGNEITSKMTNIANKIYKRVAIKSPKAYFSADAETFEIGLGIPVEKVLVFTQCTGKEQKYISIKGNLEGEYERIKPDDGISGFGGLEEQNNYSIMGNSNEIKDEHIKTMEDDKPNIKDMKYRYIKGNMHILESMDTYKNYKDQTVTVNWNMDGGAHSIDIYYKPATTVRVSYYQDGKPISHTEECSSRTDSEEHCISAGEVIIKVDILANNEDKELVEDYKLLYPEDFEVSLYKGSIESGVKDTLKEIDVEHLEYQCVLEKGIYELQIITSWNEMYVQTIEVQDKWQPVDLELYDTDSIWLESAEDPSCEVKIRASSGGDASDEEVLEHVTDVNLETDHELFDIEKLGRSGNGIWSFRVTLKDPAEHNVGKELELHAVANTDYKMAKTNEHDDEYFPPIKSGEFVLSAEEQAEAEHYFWRLLKGETVGINYYCDGIKLTEAQKKGMKILGECETEPQDMKENLRITDQGDIRLEFAPLYWFFHRVDTVKVSWNVKYTRWNHEESQEVVMELKIQYLPTLVQWGIVIIVVLLIVWVLSCLIKRRTDIFIPRMKITLESQYYEPQKIRLCRKGMMWIPWRTKVWIKYRDSTEYFPEISLEIRRNPEGNGYEILNYGTLGNDMRYRLGDGRISGSNKIISESRSLQVADRNGCWHELVMKR